MPSLWTLDDAVLAKARWDKVLRAGSVHGWHVVAIDGTEALRTSAWGCPACQVYHHQDERVESVHRVVLVQTVVRPEPEDEAKPRDAFGGAAGGIGDGSYRGLAQRLRRAFLEGYLCHWVGRGLKGTRLVILDAREGHKLAITEVLAGTCWRRRL